jgi:HTH-type transcriptional regulator, competence development regulator
MAVGKRIKELRKIRNLTQKEFADRINVSPQVVSNWEREYTKPNSEDIERIAKNLEINPNYLYGLTDNPDIVSTKGTSFATPKIIDTLAEINKLVEKYGIEQMGFFNIEEWKNLGPEDILMLEEQFKTIVKFAKKRNENNKV